ncbi:hypothetical protein FHT44_005005 [Mycolicibacterium sp. BK634]|uniref:hypothetical protein n=1 Tax=Mycolicibacterium sp. BK634 TaxID=2587099 RepID=UPI00161D81F0|nr:hypothetical protein [Mycolicibacterium sp. BK634]MBB3752493.1 hypothetical protein [Mycolicibacterium sp. BK634]
MPQSLGEVKYGKDEELERLANELLNGSVGENKRCVDRDIEKVSYELGLVSDDDLHHYDPNNDWDAQDSVFAVSVDPGDLSGIEPTICADVPDGNVRARNPKLHERRALTRHTGDDEAWGSTFEEIPLLGVNEGPRKVCTRCKQSRGLSLFSRDKRNVDGLRSWCRSCEKAAAKNRYTRKSQ